MVNGILMVVLFSLLCIFYEAMLCMYDVMLNFWSLREKENEFQLFLFPSESSYKECSETSVRCALTRGSEFISRSSGGIPLFSFQQKCKWSTEAMQGVCRLVESLELLNQEKSWRTVAAGSAQSQEGQILRSIWKSPTRSACKGPFETWVARESSGEITPLKESKGRRSLK